MRLFLTALCYSRFLGRSIFLCATIHSVIYREINFLAFSDKSADERASACSYEGHKERASLAGPRLEQHSPDRVHRLDWPDRRFPRLHPHREFSAKADVLRLQPDSYLVRWQIRRLAYQFSFVVHQLGFIMCACLSASLPISAAGSDLFPSPRSHGRSLHTC